MVGDGVILCAQPEVVKVKGVGMPEQRKGTGKGSRMTARGVRMKLFVSVVED